MEFIRCRAIAALVISIIICVLWYCIKMTPAVQAQDAGNKSTEFVWRTIDVSAAQEDLAGCAKLIEKDVDEHPELIFYNAFPTRLSRMGVILKYTIVYKKE